MGITYKKTVSKPDKLTNKKSKNSTIYQSILKKSLSSCQPVAPTNPVPAVAALVAPKNVVPIPRKIVAVVMDAVVALGAVDQPVSFIKNRFNTESLNLC